MSSERHNAGLQDLDAQIVDAEWRVIQRDARVLQQGHQLGERLSSRSTQARLLLAGVLGVAAVVGLARLARRARAAPAPHGVSAAARGHAQGPAGRDAGATPPGVQPLWLQWLPLVLQLLTASSRPAAAAPLAGRMGWLGPLLDAGRGWVAARTDRARRAATSAPLAAAAKVSRPASTRR